MSRLSSDINATSCTLVSCLAYSSTLKMEISIHFQRTTRHYSPEDRTLHYKLSGPFNFDLSPPFYYFSHGVRLSPLGTAATVCSIAPAPDDRWWWLWANRWNANWQGKPKYSEKTCPSATLSTTNPTWPDSSSNAGRRGGKPATNRLSYGTALLSPYFTCNSNRTLWNLTVSLALDICIMWKIHKGMRSVNNGPPWSLRSLKTVCWIWDSHGSDYEGYDLLVCDAVGRRQPKFRRKM
jgi:hypothetical protein